MRSRLLAGGECCAIAEGVRLHAGLGVSSAGRAVARLCPYAEECGSDNGSVQSLGALRKIKHV